MAWHDPSRRTNKCRKPQGVQGRSGRDWGQIKRKSTFSAILASRCSLTNNYRKSTPCTAAADHLTYFSVQVSRNKKLSFFLPSFLLVAFTNDCVFYGLYKRNTCLEPQWLEDWLANFWLSCIDRWTKWNRKNKEWKKRTNRQADRQRTACIRFVYNTIKL